MFINNLYGQIDTDDGHIDDDDGTLVDCGDFLSSKIKNIFF